MKTIIAWIVGIAVVGGVSAQDGRGRTLEGWAALRTHEALTRTVKPFQGAAVAELAAPGVVRMRTERSEECGRGAWDFALGGDWGQVTGLTFDFKCEDVSAFCAFRIYLRSGQGWFSAGFFPEESGEWSRIRLSPDQFSKEGRPDGWRNISRIRISGSTNKGREGEFMLRNLAVEDGSLAPALVIQANSHIARRGTDEGITFYTGKAASALKRCGVAAVTIADTELTPDDFKNRRFVVLPFNPTVPSGLAATLDEFVRGGGKLMVFYTVPAEIARILGITAKSFVRADAFGDSQFAGIARTGKGMPMQPAMAGQMSHNAYRVEPGEGCETVAVWRSGMRDTDLPAVVKSPNGIYMSHVWLGNSTAECDALMRSMVAALMPEGWLEESVAELGKRDERLATAKRLAAKTITDGSKNEFRGFWCHDAYGLPSRDWDEAVGRLKAKGFTAVLPNVAWGATAFYESKVLETAGDVARKGNALAQCVAACRRYGIECHAWKVCWNMGRFVTSETMERMAQTGRTQIAIDGKPMRGWLCPSHPLNQQAEIDAFVELAGMGVDGVHMDYIRYADGNYCFCDGCRERFERSLGRKVEVWPQAVASGGALRQEWQRFRRGNIDAVVEGVSRRVRAAGHGVKVSIAAREYMLSAAESDAQDWVNWTKRGWLDFVCPMDYTGSTAAFASLVKAQLEAVGDSAKLYPGIGISCWHTERPFAEVMANHIRAAREAGVEGWTVFNYDYISISALW